MRFYQMPNYRNPNYAISDSDNTNLDNNYDDSNNYHANHIQRGTPLSNVPTGNKSWQPNTPSKVVIPKKPGMKPMPTQPEMPMPQPVPVPTPPPPEKPVPPEMVKPMPTPPEMVKQPMPIQPEMPVKQPSMVQPKMPFKQPCMPPKQPCPLHPEIPLRTRPIRPRMPIYQPNMSTPGTCRPIPPIMQPYVRTPMMRPITPMMQPGISMSQPNNASEEFSDYYNLIYGIDPEAFENAIGLIKNAVEGEREDELFYDDLIAMAPDEDKEIIKSIRNDEINHNAYFRQMYRDFTGKEIEAPEAVEYEKPATYMEGIQRALFGELSAVERYRKIRKALPKEFYKDILFDIITDELKHACKYNYLITKNKQCINK